MHTHDVWPLSHHVSRLRRGGARRVRRQGMALRPERRLRRRSDMPDDMTKRIARFIEPFRVTPGSSVKLAKDFDPALKAGIENKQDGVGLLNDGISLLSEYQQRLAAEATRGVVVVLQALDAAGKDGTIRHVMSGVNPQGVRVESFKVPSAGELDQDYLRRYQERLPARGGIGIFHRSHHHEGLA